ncbi:hypothetical protein KIN20_003188 [Parelaphostrongylus tenuis]|uniref:Uncharacterized protein n=1 Tax=Parelaphostrongylus tenuis TaxID=148309 RepID=A0AAD5QDJ1_PARTN|nr:hypothetical protein KIN20_003188 [Parelaphostrongylus tenuis]
MSSHSIVVAFYFHFLLPNQPELKIKQQVNFSEDNTSLHRTHSTSRRPLQISGFHGVVSKEWILATDPRPGIILVDSEMVLGRN